MDLLSDDEENLKKEQGGSNKNRSPDVILIDNLD